jgi:jumonji domain-containing protein 7
MSAFAPDTAASILSTTTSDFHTSCIPHDISPIPGAFDEDRSDDFYRNYVSKSLPCVTTMVPGMELASTVLGGNLVSLTAMLGDSPISVNVTPPHGLGDAIIDGVFVLPHEETMSFREFITARLDPNGKGRVYYFSSQNDNIHTECNKLLSLGVIPPSLPFADKAFRTGPPEAINLWIGDGRAVTTMHRDPYENIYCVFKGSKTFTLLPPYMGGCLYQKMYRKGRWDCSGDDNGDNGDNGGDADAVVMDEDATEDVKWISVDVDDAETMSSPDYPLLKHVKPITITVNSGECLYLPAMWYHKVTSSGVSVAVNYWYNMDFNLPMYCMGEVCNELVGGSNNDNSL